MTGPPEGRPERDQGARVGGAGGEVGDEDAVERIGREYYDRTDYFEGEGRHLLDEGSRFQRYRIRKVLAIYDPGKEERVLDLGCGWGTFGFALAPRVREVVGVDFSEKSIAICRSRLEREPRPNLRFVRAEAQDTGLDAESFDLVIAADLLEHLYPDQTREVLAETRRLLKRGGRLSIWTPHRGHFLEVMKNRGILLRPDPTHVDYKSMGRLKEGLSKAGFSIEKAYYAESHLPGLRAVERTFLSTVPLLRRRIAVLARRS